MNFNIFNIIIVCGIVQGFIFSAIVFNLKKYRSKPYELLALLVLIISISNLYYWFKDIGIEQFWQRFRLLYLPLDLLILPIYYFFVCEYLSIKRKYSFALLVPFLIRLTFQVFIVLYNLFFNAELNFSNSTIFLLKRFDEYGSIAFMMFIIYLIYEIIVQYERNPTCNVKRSTKWLKQLLYFGIGLCLFWLLVVLFNDVIPANLNFRKKYYFIWIALSVLIYWLGYLGIYELGIFNQRQLIRENLQNKNNATFKSAKQSNNRFDEIDSKIKEDKLYTNPYLSLENLAKIFNLSEGYISQLINNHTNTNFSTYINNLRVEEAKAILDNNDFSNYTITAVGFEAGFNSKSAFYSAFKKQTGSSPLDYKKINLS